jgi:hypothetical protein
LTLERFIEQSKLVHDDRYDYSKVVYGSNNNDKVCIICKEHGEFWQTPRGHLNEKQGCPKCKLSKGELTLERYLQKNNVMYESQKRFLDCKDKLPLPFDFYLPEVNICIEYDGQQHYRTWNGKQTERYLLDFQKTRQHDEIKTNYCKENGIRLIRVSYTIKLTEGYLDSILQDMSLCQSLSS